MLSLESPDAEFDADSAHQELLKIRLGELSESFAEPVHGKLLIDSSKGLLVIGLQVSCVN